MRSGPGLRYDGVVICRVRVWAGGLGVAIPLFTRQFKTSAVSSRCAETSRTLVRRVVAAGGKLCFAYSWKSGLVWRSDARSTWQVIVTWYT